MLTESPRRRRRPLSQGQQVAILAVVLVAAVVTALIVFSHSSDAQRGRRGGPLYVPDVSVSTTINGNVARPVGRAISLATGREVTIVAHFTVPAGVTVRDLILQTGAPSEDTPPDPRATALAQLHGPLPNSHSISANWVIPAGPSPQVVVVQFTMDFTHLGAANSVAQARPLFTFVIPA